jgi:hypothetical protein
MKMFNAVLAALLQRDEEIKKYIENKSSDNSSFLIVLLCSVSAMCLILLFSHSPVFENIATQRGYLSLTAFFDVFAFYWLLFPSIISSFITLRFNVASVYRPLMRYLALLSPLYTGIYLLGFVSTNLKNTDVFIFKALQFVLLIWFIILLVRTISKIYHKSKIFTFIIVLLLIYVFTPSTVTEYTYFKDLIDGTRFGLKPDIWD